MAYVLGIDLGTSSLKGILINKQGEVVGESSYDYPIETPKIGCSEQNPELWMGAVVEIKIMMHSGSLWFLFIVELPPCGWGWTSGLSRFPG